MADKRGGSSRSIGDRAFKYAIIAAVFFIFVTTCIASMIEYKKRTAAVQADIERIVDMEKPSIENALWDMDAAALQTHVSGLKLYPYIDFASIEDIAGLAISGRSNEAGEKRLTYPLTHIAPDGRVESLGLLTLQVDVRKLHRDTVSDIALVAIGELLFAVFGVILVFLLFSRMITSPLDQIVEYMETDGADLDGPLLSLRKKDFGDEFDLFVDHFNSMKMALSAARASELRVFDELKMSEMQNRVLIEEAPDAILVVDCDEGIIMCNQRAEALFGTPREEVLGKSLLDFLMIATIDGFDDEEKRQAALSRVMRGEVVHIERVALGAGGNGTICEVFLSRIPAQGRSLVRVSCIDISERVRAAEALSHSLHENEILLQEVYHRTQNNMQLISSYLNLGAMASKDEGVKKIIDDMIVKILAMSLVHQKLYESRDLSRINLGDYANDLVSEISTIWFSSLSDVRIGFSADPDIVSSFDFAIPCGLVITELTCNAMKHAFPNGRTGRIDIAIRRREGSQIELSVADDGVGLPPGFDSRTGGKTGMLIIRALVEGQLDGTVSFASGQGTRCVALIQNRSFIARI